jgi:hypothetical protein
MSEARLLLVTFHFPPDGAIGAVRPYEFAKLLPQHGVNVWVLTVLPEYAERFDPSALPEGIPEDRIIRTPVLPSRRDRYLQMTQGLRRWIRGRTGKAISFTGFIVWCISQLAPHATCLAVFHRLVELSRLVRRLAAASASGCGFTDA